MKHLYQSVYFFTTLLLLSAIDAKGQIPCDGVTVVLTEDGICDPNPYFLVFEDNFDGNNLDMIKWKPINPASSDPGSGAYYNENNVLFSPHTIAPDGSDAYGVLSIVAKKQTITTGGNTWDYTSSFIESAHNYEWGIYEIRCKIPFGEAMFPAFWTYGESSGSGYEIDVFEFFNQSSAFNEHASLTYHSWEKPPYPTPAVDHKCSYNYHGPADYTQGFHTFKVLWNRNLLFWYIDNVLVRKATLFYSILGQPLPCSSINAFNSYILNNWYPRHEMKIIVNSQVQTQYLSESNPGIFPSSYDIDYIRFYAQKPCMGGTYSNTSELNLLNNQFNYIAASDITFENNIILNTSDQLTIQACNRITLNPGVTIESNNRFVGEINDNANACCGRNPSLNQIVNTDSLEISSINNANNFEANTNQIQIIPNPNNGIFEIFFHPKQEQLLIKELKIFNLIGIEIQSFINLESKTKISIDISSQPNGIYYIKATDNSGETQTTKFIKN